MEEPRIAATSLRHSVDVADILHAYRNATYFTVGTDDMRIAIGPATDGALLEIGFVRAAGETVILHAMPARKKFL